jgi:hypothetical protein
VSFAVLLVACGVPSQEDITSESLIAFLQEEYEGVPGADHAVYFHSLVDLNGDDEDEVLVLMLGPGLCGSGGCNMMILEKAIESYRIVTETTITNQPIQVLEPSSNGWRDLAVTVRGGGITAYEAVLRFDGTSYPRNPSAPPAEPLAEAVSGEVVIDFSSPEEGTPLYSP